MVPRCQRARTQLLPRDESLLPLTPDVPPTQTPLEYPDSYRGRCSSDPTSTPNTGYPTPGEAGALQPPDSNPPNPQLQRNSDRDAQLQAYDPFDPGALSATEQTPAFLEHPTVPPKEADFHGTLNTDPKPPNRARRFLRKFFQMVTDNRAVLRA